MPGLPRWLILLPLLLSMLGASSLRAQTSAAEAELKAAILAGLLPFVSWSAAPSTGPRSDLHLCPLGRGALNSVLSRLHQRNMGGQRLLVRPLIEVTQMAQAAKTEWLRDCQVVVLAQEALPLLADLRARLENAGVLIVSDVAELAGSRTVMVQLDIAGGRVVFDVDLGLTRSAGLDISSRALKLARSVWE